MEYYTQLLMKQVMHLYVQRSMYLLREWDIHPAKAGMLWALKYSGGLSQKELAKKMGITPPSMTAMIKKMEAEQLIEKHQDEKDQRIARIWITEKGKKIADEMDIILKQLEQESFQNMSEEEVMLLRRLLLQIKENLLERQKGAELNHEKII